MLKKAYLIFVSLLFLQGQAMSQIDSSVVNELKKHEFGGVYRSSISGNFGGVGGIVGVTYESLFSPHWRMEAGFGWLSAGYGFQCYPWMVKRGSVRPYLNFRNSFVLGSYYQALWFSGGAGITYFAKFKMNFGLDLNYSYGKYFMNSSGIPQPEYFWMAINLKIGYRFSFKVMKRNREFKKSEKNK